MKKHLVLATLWGLVAGVPLQAQNIVGDFLDRYRAPQVELTILETSPTPPASLAAMAQDGGVPLRVTDVIRMALESNLDIGISRFEPSIADYAIAAAYERFDPTLTLSGAVNRNTTASTTQLDGAQTNTRLTGNYGATLSQQLQYGSSYQVRFTMNRISTNSGFSTVNPAYNGQLSYQFTQPLLRNRGTLINTGPIRIAQNNLEISEIQFEQQVMDLVTQVTNFYWDLVYAREEIRVQQASLELAQRTLNDNRMQVEIGTLAPIEVVQAESAVATRRESLVLAQYSQTQIEDSIKQMISRVPDPALVLLSLNPVEEVRGRTDQIIPVEDAIRLALLNRPEMRQLELDIQNNDINLAVAKNALLPSLDLNVSYTQSGIGGNTFERSGLGDQTVVTVVPGGIGDAFSDIFGFDFTGYSIGFSLQIPLSNKSAQANVARLTVQKMQAESLTATMAQRVATQVRDAYNQIEMNRARIEAAQIARELAERRLDAEQRKFTLGASAIRFVLDEQQNVTQAQTNEIRALVDYVKAIVNYDRAIGRTLERNNIQIEQELRPNIASTESGGVAGL
jgi:outer membrane protein TolC